MIKSNLKIAIRILWEKQTFFSSQYTEPVTEYGSWCYYFYRPTSNFRDRPFSSPTKSTSKDTHAGNKGNGTNPMVTAPWSLATQIEGVSFVEKTVKVRLAGKHNLQTDKGDIPIDIKFSEPSFFHVFGFKLLSGTAQSLTHSSTSIFLTEETAKKIFGNTNALGQTVQFEKLGSYTVEGIIHEPAFITHLPIEAMLLSIILLKCWKKKE